MNEKLQLINELKFLELSTEEKINKLEEIIKELNSYEKIILHINKKKENL